MLSSESIQTLALFRKTPKQTYIEGDTHVYKTVRILQVIAVVLALALAVPAFADSYKRNLTLADPAKLGGTELKPGNYALQFDGSKITLKQGRKVVAEAAAEWVDVKFESRGDTVVIDKGVITEVRIEGKKRVIRVKL
jgi:hypothetical protein